MTPKVKNEEKTQVTYKEVKGTPFTIANVNNEKFHILLGNIAVTSKPFKNEEDCKKYINEKSWEIIASTICIITKKVYEYEKNNEKNNVQKN